MKRCIGITLCIFFLNAISALGQQKTFFKDLLEELEHSYDVTFAYDDELVRKTPIYKPFITSEDLAIDLANIENLVPFHFSKVQDVYLVIPNVSQVDSTSLYSIEIKVIDARSREVLPVASILLDSEMSSKGLVTDNSGVGVWLVNSLEERMGRLRVQYMGYNPVYLPLYNFSRDSSVVVALRASNAMLKEIVIEDMGGARHFFSDQLGKIKFEPLKSISNIGLGTGDLNQGLRNLPGISSTNESEGGIQVRGEPSASNLILMEGITVYNPDHFFGVFSAFNSFFINNVAIYKGVYPANYGGRTSSVIDYTNENVDMFERFHGGINLNAFTSEMWLSVPVDSALSIQLSGRVSNSYFNGGKMSKDTYSMLSSVSNLDARRSVLFDTKVQEAKFWFYDMNLKLGYKINEQNTIYWNSYLSKDQYLFEYPVPLSASNVGDSLVYLKELRPWENKGHAIKWEHSFDKKLGVTTGVTRSNYQSVTRFDKNYTLDVIWRFDEDQGDGGFTLANPEQIQTSSALQKVEDTKVYYEFDKTISSDTKWKHGSSVSMIEMELSEYSEIADSLHYNEKGSIYETYFSYLVDKDKYTLMTGVRFGGLLSTGRTFWVDPRFSFFYRVLPQLTLKVSAGVFHQPIQMYQDIGRSRQGNTSFLLANGQDVPVKSSNQFSFGADWSKGNWVLGFDSYYKENTSLSLTIPTFLIQDDFSARSVLAREIIAGIDMNIGYYNSFYKGGITYSIKRGQYQLPSSNVYHSVIRSNLDQRHEFKALNEFRWKKWTTSFSFYYGSGVPFTNRLLLNDDEKVSFNNDELPEYHRMDASISYQLSWKSFESDIGISCYNVYDRKNIRYKIYQEYIPVEQTNTGNIIVPEVDLDDLPGEYIDVALLGRVINFFAIIKF